MVEEMENKIRSTLNEIYFSKTRDIVNGLRSLKPLKEQLQKADLRRDLANAIKMRNASRGESPNSYS